MGRYVTAKLTLKQIRARDLPFCTRHAALPWTLFLHVFVCPDFL